MKKKILLSILCVCMVLTMMPTLAFAEVVTEAPSTKGVMPQFEKDTVYVKTKDATEAIFKVKNYEDYDATGVWKVYDDYKKGTKDGITVSYDANTRQLTLINTEKDRIYGKYSKYYYVSYTPKDGTESEISLCVVSFVNVREQHYMKNYIIDWGTCIPWKFEISENSQTFDKVTYQLGNPNAKEEDANLGIDYKVTRDPKTDITTFEFTNEFMKEQFGKDKEQKIVFNFKYKGGPGDWTITKGIQLIDKVEESKTKPTESKWKKGSAESLSFTVNDDKRCEKGSIIDGKSMAIAGITRSDSAGREPSIVVTKLEPEYLNTLECGWHRMEFFFGESKESGYPMMLRLLSDGKATLPNELVQIEEYLRHVVGDFLIYDDTHNINSFSKEPPVYEAPKRQPPTPDPVPTDPSTNPPIVYPPVITPVVPDTPVVPVPPVVEPVDPAEPDTTVDGDETSTTNLKTDNENNKSNSPQTGDNTNPWTWMILLGISGIGLGSILINKKRNTNR